ncbi:MAG: aminotransferase class V-fold PLP-dependent enzyme, partial [Candidatus Spechtbacterales bacterium]|nr:aminotransferase class V-fold PLP-dependent enzyme [Candidatus Spechtbacterales bacterium]
MKFLNKNKKENIYLDYAATTPVSSRVLDAMQPYFSEYFANPSSLHLAGQKVRSDIDIAREDVGNLIGATWKEVYFAPSATYSINLALRGIVKKNKDPHIITTSIEHSAVLNTCKE